MTSFSMTPRPRMGITVARYSTRADAAGAHEPKSEKMMAALFERRALIRRARRANLARRTRDASLGRFKTMDQIRLGSSEEGRPTAYRISYIYSTFLVRTPPTSLLRGPAGVGKTTIAQNIGSAALEAGYTVRFSTCDPR